MRSAYYPIFLCFALLLSAGLVVLQDKQSRSNTLEAGLPILASAPSFTLVDSNGSEFSSNLLSGKIWLFHFFFASCDGPCPVITSRVSKIYSSHQTEPRLRMVSVSIDPERDTPEALRAYARKLGVSTERWHFLTGEYESIKSLAQKGFKVGGLDSGLDHSNRIILVDAQGNIRGTYNGVDPSAVASLEEALKILLMPQS